MIDTVLSWTELPNLHPAIVHFPIAFVALAVCYEIAAVARGRAKWLDNAAASVWAAAGLAAWAALWAGERAADSLTVPPTVQGHLNTHSDWGHYTLYTVAGIAVLRLALVFFRPAPRGGWVWPSLFLLAGLVAAAFVAKTADLGGGLVFRHGLAVADPAEHDSRLTERKASGADTGKDESGKPPLSVSEDGSVTWRPAQRGESLEGVLTDVDGSAPDGLSTTDGEGPGLTLEIGGAGFALLPDSCGDVQVEADLSLSGFEGTFGLAHHVGDVDRAALFAVEAPAGPARLIVRSGGDGRVLDESVASPAEGRVTLAASGAGSHFRGMIDGELIVHGHRDALPDGRCGLFYDGDGSVTISALRAIPIAGDE